MMEHQFITDELCRLSPQEGLQLVGETFGHDAKLSSSLGVEDQLLTHWIAKLNLPISIFTIDTGRLFQETYDLMALTRQKYGIDIDVLFPEQQQVEKLVTAKGPNSFYESVENRKECCHIRKVIPLQRALEGAKVWITGLRADQSDNRRKMPIAEWDPRYQVVKYNPLLFVSETEVNRLVKENNIPVNTLHKKGYPSIGCAPCTRAVLPGEDSRAGRWWWESTSKECGLHETKVH